MSPTTNGGHASSNDQTKVGVAVQVTSSFALRPSPLSNFASLYSLTTNQPLKSFSPREDASLDVVGGTTSDGLKAIAFVPPKTQGSQVMVPPTQVLPVPTSISLDDAIIIPHLALGVLPALMQQGLHEQGGGGGESQIGDDSSRPVCVVTGCGMQAQFITQILSRCWGHRVVVATRRNGQLMTQLGASQVVDYTKESFSDVLKRNKVLVVVDTVGVDADGISSALQKATGAAYVSSMSSTTRTMMEQGLFKGASMLASMFGKKTAPVVDTKGYLLPEKKGLEVVNHAMTMVAGGKVLLQSRAADVNDYMDAIMWPKDSESGYRYGFPSATTSSYTTTTSEEDDSRLLKQYSKAMAESSDEQSELDKVLEFFGEGVLKVMGDTVPSPEGNRKDAPTVLFISAPSCEVCRQVRPKVQQLANEFPKLRFLNLSADPGNHKIAMFLRVPGYPFFIVYRGGPRVFEHGGLDVTLIKEIFLLAKGATWGPFWSWW